MKEPIVSFEKTVVKYIHEKKGIISVSTQPDIGKQSAKPTHKNSFWESPCLIPVFLSLLKDFLRSAEAQGKNHSKTIHLPFYWKQYRHWEQAPLNPKQRQWLQEIRVYLNGLTQMTENQPG